MSKSSESVCVTENTAVLILMFVFTKNEKNINDCIITFFYFFIINIVNFYYFY